MITLIVLAWLSLICKLLSIYAYNNYGTVWGDMWKDASGVSAFAGLLWITLFVLMS